jgi:serine/threonine protein kinase
MPAIYRGCTGLIVVVEGHQWVGDHVEFTISTCDNVCGVGSVRRRFREIRQFGEQLRAELGDTVTLPRLPHRNPISSVMKLQLFAGHRVDSIQCYFDGLLALWNDEVSKKLSEFLEVTMEPILFGLDQAAKETPRQRNAAFEDEFVMKSDADGSYCDVQTAIRKSTGAPCMVASFQRNGLEESAHVELPKSFSEFAVQEKVYESSSAVHIVFEHLKGGNLFDRIRQCQRLSEAEAAPLVKQLLTTVSSMHNKGMIHGDIRPETLIFERDGNATMKLLNCGMAKEWDRMYAIADITGTPGYSAPEVFRGASTDKADLWSVGVITYMMVCGCTPWRSSQIQRWTDINSGRPGEPYFFPARWNALSWEAKDFIKQLLKVDAGDRLSAVDALAHQWLR